MNRSRHDVNGRGMGRQRRRKTKRQAGQIVVEYVLLLSIGVVLALSVTKALVGRGADSPGVVTQVWNSVNQAIGADLADDPRP